MKKKYKQNLIDSFDQKFFISGRGNLQYITQQLYYLFNPARNNKTKMYLTEKQLFKQMTKICSDRGITYNKWEISASLNLLTYIEVIKPIKSGYIYILD